VIKFVKVLKQKRQKGVTRGFWRWFSYPYKHFGGGHLKPKNKTNKKNKKLGFAWFSHFEGH
jgi:hypothetical protein